MNTAPPTITVHKISPGDDSKAGTEEVEEESAATSVRLYQATLSAGVKNGDDFGAAMETTTITPPTTTTTMTPPPVGRTDSSKSIHLLTPPDTAKILQPASSDGNHAAFQTVSTPASPLNSAPYSPIVSKRGRSSAVSCFLFDGCLRSVKPYTELLLCSMDINHVHATLRDLSVGALVRRSVGPSVRR